MKNLILFLMFSSLAFGQTSYYPGHGTGGGVGTSTNGQILSNTSNAVTGVTVVGPTATGGDVQLSNAPPPGSYCGFVGDSLTYGYQSSNPTATSYPAQLIGASLGNSTSVAWTSAGMPWFAGCTFSNNFGITGATLSPTLTSDYTSHVHPKSPAVTGAPGYLFIMIGANDIPLTTNTVALVNTYYQTTMAGYIATILADGWNVIFLTQTQNYVEGDFFLVEGYNDMLKAGTYSFTPMAGVLQQARQPIAVVDTFNALNNPSDLTYFYTDNEHFTDAGYRVIAETVNATMMAGGSMKKAGTPWKSTPWTGGGNALIGPWCGQALTTANGTTCWGVQSLFANTTGNQDTGFGRQAGNGITTGSANTALGYLALNGNPSSSGLTTGSRNVGVGEYAGGSFMLGAANSVFLGGLTGSGSGNVTITATCTSGSADITTSNTTGVVNGYSMVSLDCLLPSDTTVSSFVTNTSVHMSHNAGASVTNKKIYVALNPCDNCAEATVVGDSAELGLRNSTFETVLGSAAIGNGSSSVTLGRTSDKVYVASGLVATNTLYSAAGTALPTCNSGNNGTLAVVIDATTPTYLGAYASGGAVVAPVVCNGSGWVTH